MLPALAGTVGVPLAASSTSGFSINISLRPPAGCISSLVTPGPGSSPVFTLTCGANLFVNVQPTLVPNVATSFPPPGPGDTVATSGGGDPRPPSELSRTSPNLGDINDTRTGVGGQIYVERRATLATDLAGAGTSWLQMTLNPQASSTDVAAGKAVEMWLTF